MQKWDPAQPQEGLLKPPVKPQISPNMFQPRYSHRSAFFKCLLFILLALQLLLDFWVIAPFMFHYVLPGFFSLSEIQGNKTQATEMAENCGKDIQNVIPFHRSKYQALTKNRVKEILAEFNHKITYVKSMNTVFVTMPKAGSTTFWQTMYLGFTGKNWSRACGYVHYQSSPCWGSHIVNVLELSPEKQFRLLSSNLTTRVAIQREPFSRLISGYKNKIACDFIPESMAYINAQGLRINANLPPGHYCMNISEFADVLDTIRTHVGQPGYLKSWQKIDKHFMPQNFYADEILYHEVLDVKDLSDATKMAPFLDQLPYSNMAKEAKFHKTKTRDEAVLIDDKSAQKLHRYAQLAVTVPP